MKRLLGLLGDNTKEVSVAEKAIGGQRWVAVVGGSACFLCGGGPQKKESCRRNIVTSLRKSVPRDTPYYEILERFHHLCIAQNPVGPRRILRVRAKSSYFMES
jgi:hypothetical protein